MPVVPSQRRGRPHGRLRRPFHRPELGGMWGIRSAYIQLLYQNFPFPEHLGADFLGLLFKLMSLLQIKSLARGQAKVINKILVGQLAVGAYNIVDVNLELVLNIGPGVFRGKYSTL